MAELGFRRNVLARALASQRTRIIAVAFPAAQHRLGATALSILTSAAGAASDRGHNIVLWPTGYEDGKLEEYVRGGLVDGVLLMEVRADDPRIAVLEALDMPFGLIGRTRRDESRAFVDIDFENAVIDGLAHLRELGHREIALVVGETDDEDFGGYGPILRTTEGYLERMAELGLRPVVVPSSHDAVGGMRAAEVLAAEHPEVTGVLVLNESALVGFLSGVARQGYAVPRDLSVLGLATSRDNVAIANPMLSTIAAPGDEVGLQAATRLIESLEGELTEPAHVLVRCTLQLADSTAPPRPDDLRPTALRPTA